MTGVIFDSWMKKLNQKIQSRNILLFMDNRGAHPKITFSNIKLAFSSTKYNNTFAANGCWDNPNNKAALQEETVASHSDVRG